jgi:nicotinamidase/pyrazinamidase
MQELATITVLEVVPTPGDCLLIVDVQNDFLPGGQLAVKHADRIIGPLNDYITEFASRRLSIVASRDWHPVNHVSFLQQGGRWRSQCVKGTYCAQFFRQLKLPRDVTIISKGESPRHEAYSAFDGTGLGLLLRTRRVRRLFIGGVATRYCVLATVEDALREGFAVVLLRDATQSVDRAPLNGAGAVSQMTREGASAVTWRIWPDGKRRITATD